MKNIISLCLIIPFLFFNCQETSQNTRAFYYWKTELGFNQDDFDLKEKLNVEQFYVRCFDIDWSAGYNDAIPLGILKIQLEGKPFSIIPTIFIVNRVFTHIEENQLEFLAERILKKIPYKTQINEIQIDCDWTASTRDKYFKFLEILREQVQGDRVISATIRLHQYRDRKLMGIPPVDRGMLMVYNVADPKDHNTKNAILDAEIVENYIKGRKYPLPLDIALPMFHWGAWFRNHEFQAILSGWDMVDAADKNTYQGGKNHFYAVQKDTVIRNHYLREGDIIRMDGAFSEEMKKTISIIKKKINPKDCRIAFFDWDEANINQFHEKDIERYYTILE